VHWKYGGLQDRFLLFKGSIGNVVVNTPASGQLGWNTSRKAYMLFVMFERFGGSRRSNGRTPVSESRVLYCSDVLEEPPYPRTSKEK